MKIKSIYNIESKKKLLNSKRTIKYLDELNKKIDKLDRYYRDYDDYEYKGIKDIKDLFKLSTDKDYYEPILAKIMVIMVIMFNTKVMEIKY